MCSAMVSAMDWLFSDLSGQLGGSILSGLRVQFSREVNYANFLHSIIFPILTIIKKPT